MIETLGAASILGLVVLLILAGRLVPKSTLDDLRRDKDQQIQLWHQAYENTRAALDIEREHIQSLISLAESAREIFNRGPNDAE